MPSLGGTCLERMPVRAARRGEHALMTIANFAWRSSLQETAVCAAHIKRSKTVSKRARAL